MSFYRSILALDGSLAFLRRLQHVALVDRHVADHGDRWHDAGDWQSHGWQSRDWPSSEWQRDWQSRPGYDARDWHDADKDPASTDLTADWTNGAIYLGGRGGKTLSLSRRGVLVSHLLGLSSLRVGSLCLDLELLLHMFFCSLIALRISWLQKVDGNWQWCLKVCSETVPQA